LVVYLILKIRFNIEQLKLKKKKKKSFVRKNKYAHKNYTKCFSF